MGEKMKPFDPKLARQARASTCEGKSSFPTVTKARNRARRMQMQYGEPMMAYHCRVCGHWHIGGTDDRHKRLLKQQLISRAGRRR